MIAFLRGLVFAVVTLIIIVFALCNRAPVLLTLNPLGKPVTVPLFLVGLGGLAFGFTLGALLAWARSLGLRFTRRRQDKRIARLEKDLEKQDLRDATVQSAPALTQVSPSRPYDYE